MRSLKSRLAIVALIVMGALLVVAATSKPNSKAAHSDKLVILSTTDVKGKPSPCGCHVPKGGLARRASYRDSLKELYGQVSLVDNGSFFPEDDLHQDAGPFLMDAMKMIDVDAVGTGVNDLRWGYAFLKSNVKRTQLPMTSANLIDVPTRKPAFAPYVIKKVGSVKVGYFSLMTDKVDLGLARDSLRVEEPVATARTMVAELHKKGATVVVLLSQLGKVESEDLVTSVPGIDAVICGRNVPVIQKGRMIKNTVASYGGEQGHFISRTVLTLDGAGKATAGDNETVQLGPEVQSRADILAMVKAFEDAQNVRIARLQKEKSVEQAAVQQANQDHFVGAEVCARCHQSQYDQWKTTSHSLAWNTLVDQKKEAEVGCYGCHVVGYQQNGGFQTNTDVPRLANVQCENCHGMGTRHDAFANRTKPITQETCIGCHNPKQDPGFNFDRDLALVAHGNLSGATVKSKTGTMHPGH